MDLAMSQRGRKPGFVMPEAHRVKIQNSNILNALIEHAEGKRDMSATQVSAGLGLLRKVLPDLSQSDINHTVRSGLAAELADDALADIATGSGEGTAEAPIDPTQLN